MNQQDRLIRKLIHLATGLLLFGLTWVLPTTTLLVLILAGTVFAFVTFPLKRFRLLHKTTEASYGTLFYPIGILTSFLILQDLPITYFRITLLVLTISDTLANITGSIKSGNGNFRIWHDKKSWYGIAGYTLSVAIILYALLPIQPPANIGFVLFVILLAINMEIISLRGSDNFSIPAGLALFFLIHENHHLNYSFLIGTMLFLGVGCIFLYRSKILTRMGSLTAYVLGMYLLAILGWPWTLTVVLFFITSVFLTRIHDVVAAKSDKSSQRNAWQVLANILWAVVSSVFYIISGNPLFIMLFIAFIAAVTADTWSSEVGPIFHKKSFSFSDWKMHKAGTNGGISLAGTLAALAGAFLISAVSYQLFFATWHLPEILMLTLSGFLACFADTFLGTFAEEKLNRIPFFHKKASDESLSPNDLVNFLGSLAAVLFFLLLKAII